MNSSKIGYTIEIISKLSQLNSSSTEPEIRAAFKDVAEDLFRNYHIEKSGKSYSFANIEFYFCNPKHPDIITYPRNIDAGRWFFHQSGIDLTFKSSYTTYENKDGVVDLNKPYAFGGILIRKIKNNETVFDGPYKCEWELFDSFDAFNSIPEEWPKIVKNETAQTITPHSCLRKFSYSEDQMRKKYEELTQKVYNGICPLSFDDFRKLIKEEKLAYSI